jgi:hypothetical protein
MCPQRPLYTASGGGLANWTGMVQFPESPFLQRLSKKTERPRGYSPCNATLPYMDGDPASDGRAIELFRSRSRAILS